MPPELPFTRFLAVEMDVTSTSIGCALARWWDVHSSFPTVVWVHSSDLINAEAAILCSPENSLIRRLTPIPDPGYEEYWWSVGTHLDKGFGSVGA